MAWDWGNIIGTVAGGLLGSNDKLTQSTNSQTVAKDPRIMNSIYGLLDDSKAVYDTQRQNGGLNPMQRAGLQQQANVLSDPTYNVGFEQMRNLGSSLMGGGVAGNPFTNGAMLDGSWRQGLPNAGQQRMANSGQGLGGGSVPSYMPAGFNASNSFQASTYTPPAPAMPGTSSGGLLGGTPESIADGRDYGDMTTSPGGTFSNPLSSTTAGGWAKALMAGLPGIISYAAENWGNLSDDEKAAIEAAYSDASRALDVPGGDYGNVGNGSGIAGPGENGSW